MTAYKGALVLLKIGDGAMPESFVTIGGLIVTDFMITNHPIVADALGGDAWRSLAGNGERYVTISGEGVFTNNAAEQALRQHAFTGGTRNYTLCFGNGDTLTGVFIATRYGRSGDYANEEKYSLTLESAGSVQYDAA